MSYQPPPPPPGSETPSEGEPTRRTDNYPDPGGYTPPPPGGEYNQPPPGAYTPPSPGGYTPPTYGGGYGQTPPPPPPGYYPPEGYSNYGTPPPKAPSNIFASYLNAVTKPQAETYEAEIPNASWGKVFIGVAIVAAATIVLFLALGAYLVSQTEAQMAQMPGYTQADIDMVRGVLAAIVGPVGAIVIGLVTFLTFFLGAGVLFLTAKMFGGTGGGFMVHCYLLSLSYVPVRMLTLLLSFIPCIGSLATLVLPLYQVYCAGQSMRASQRMEPGKAMLAAFIPAIVVIVLLCGCVFLAITSALSQAGR